MSRADLIRSLSAPPELIEADLVDQLADASASLESLRSSRPAEPDAAWSRHYALLQGIFHKALASLLKHRQTTAAPAQAQTPPVSIESRPMPTAPAPPAAVEPAPAPSPPLDLSTLNRHQRRRLDALRRASPDRRQRMLSSTSPRPDRSNPHPSAPPTPSARPMPVLSEAPNPRSHPSRSEPTPPASPGPVR